MWSFTPSAGASHESPMTTRHDERMDSYACAPCLLAGQRRQAITVYAGNAVCDAHLIQGSVAGFGTNYERSRATVDYRRNVEKAFSE